MDSSVQDAPRTQSSSVNKLAILLLCSALSVAFLHRYAFAIYIIEGPSMSPTLQAGDRALVNMLLGRTGRIQRGQVVLVRDGYADYATKRVVGLPGEILEIKADHVFINGRLLPETYLLKRTKTVSKHSIFLLGVRNYFVMGDNREDSLDSRDYGPITREAIVGSYSRSFWASR